MRGFKLRTVVREPLLHFLLIGLALFLLYGRVSPGDSNSHRIVVGQSELDDMVRQYQSTWTRAPTPSETRQLIDTYIHDEIAYREGLSMGLDKDDAVIKRRVRQKYELIAEEDERSGATDADLAAYLKAHPEEFRRPAIVSFDQVYFDPTITTPQAVSAVKAALQTGADPTTLGQPSMLPRYIVKSNLDLVARDFGDNFAKGIAVAPVGAWAGPIVSGIGVHLVRVRQRAPAVLPPLGQIRAAVEREWESDRRRRSNLDDYLKARAGYDVIIKAKVP